MIDGLTRIERKLKKMEQAFKEATGYKKKQIEFRILCYKREHFSKTFWDSKTRGTYRKKGKLK